jgi:hypothetical protein
VPTKPLDQLSPAYKARLEREIAHAAKEGREFSRQAARGHKPPPGKTEHQARREREIAKYGSAAAKLRPWEIAQLRLVGATGQQILDVAQTPNVHLLLKKQRERIAGTLPGIPKSEWDDNIPDVLYYYPRSGVRNAQ